MASEITTFLMFEGRAEEAMNFYTSLFKDSGIVGIERYGPGDQGKEGSVKLATFRLGAHRYMCIDSPVSHGFTFTPAMSLYVHCDRESEVDTLFERLSEGGKVLMPLGAYPFSAKFGWLNDRFGVSWQLSLRA